MLCNSITGIRANLDEFSKSAVRIARVETNELAIERVGETVDHGQGSEVTDMSQEVMNIIVAQRGVEANLSALKTALALSGQMVDILS